MAVAAVAALILGGCTSAGSGQSESGQSATPGATGTSAPAESKSAGGTTSGDRSPSADSTAGSAAGSAGSSGACTTSDLSADLTQGDGGGAGSTYPDLVLTNTGSTACTLRGFPGVSLVGDDNGTQLGAPATRDEGAAVVTVTLAPGGSAHSALRITEAGNYDAAQCSPKAADGLRVYPPDQEEALFVRTSDFTACTSTDIELISVQALQPGTD